jgi:hypothetical protein
MEGHAQPEDELQVCLTECYSWGGAVGRRPNNLRIGLLLSLMREHARVRPPSPFSTAVRPCSPPQPF